MGNLFSTLPHLLAKKKQSMLLGEKAKKGKQKSKDGSQSNKKKVEAYHPKKIMHDELNSQRDSIRRRQKEHKMRLTAIKNRDSRLSGNISKLSIPENTVSRPQHSIMKSTIHKTRFRPSISKSSNYISNGDPSDNLLINQRLDFPTLPTRRTNLFSNLGQDQNNNIAIRLFAPTQEIEPENSTTAIKIERKTSPSKTLNSWQASQRSSFQLKQRLRRFEISTKRKRVLFANYSFNQYDHQIKNDGDMQKVILRDQLLVLQDKLSYLKCMISGQDYFANLTSKEAQILRSGQIPGEQTDLDQYGGTCIINVDLFQKMNKLSDKETSKLQGYNLTFQKLNVLIENLVGLMDKLVYFLIKDLLQVFDNIGLPGSPLQEIKDQGVNPFYEIKNLEENLILLNRMFEFFREAVDCYFVLCRNHKNKVYPPKKITLILQIVQRSRFSAGKLTEKVYQVNKFMSEGRRSDQVVASQLESMFSGRVKDCQKKEQILEDLKSKRSRAANKKKQTREAKIDLGKETSNKTFDFLHGGAFEKKGEDWKRGVKNNNEEAKRLRGLTKYLDKVVEVIKYSTTEDPLARVNLIDRLITEVSNKSSVKTKRNKLGYKRSKNREKTALTTKNGIRDGEGTAVTASSVSRYSKGFSKTARAESKKFQGSSSQQDSISGVEYKVVAREVEKFQII